MVRLKAVREALGTQEYDTTFQFHYGSIKGEKRFVIPDGFSAFQFHYGSIKGRPR
jgi:hypothetical protein